MTDMCGRKVLRLRKAQDLGDVYKPVASEQGSLQFDNMIGVISCGSTQDGPLFAVCFSSGHMGTVSGKWVVTQWR